MYTGRRRWAVALIAASALSMAACSTDSAGTSAPSASVDTSKVDADVIAAVAQSKPADVQGPGEALDLTALKGKKVFEIPSVPTRSCRASPTP